MSKGRILYVNQEITPFTEETPNARFCRYMPQYAQEHGREIRVFMPRFSSISERKNQLHEVIRLSGMNLIVNKCDHQLIIKVGSISSARMQTYFIDNEEYFTKRGGLFENGKLEADADERLLFFCRGTLEAVRKLAWRPHVVHFTGWFTGMIPFYLRRINKENAFFNGTKMVVTLVSDMFDEKFSDSVVKKLKNDGATAKDLRMYESLDYMSLMKGAIAYSQGVIIGDDRVPEELIAYAKDLKRTILEYNSNEAIFYEEINKMYDTLAGSNMDS